MGVDELGAESSVKLCRVQQHRRLPKILRFDQSARGRKSEAHQSDHTRAHYSEAGGASCDFSRDVSQLISGNGVGTRYMPDAPSRLHVFGQQSHRVSSVGDVNELMGQRRRSEPPQTSG